MKKLLSVLLLVCTCVLALPMVSVLAKDGADSQGTAAPAITYDDLYVKDGMTLWLDAYGNDNQSLHFDTGVWEGKVGELSGKLEGGAYDAATNPTGWRMAEGGGIVYRFRSLDEYNEKSAATGLVSPRRR